MTVDDAVCAAKGHCQEQHILLGCRPVCANKSEIGHTCTSAEPAKFGKILNTLERSGQYSKSSRYGDSSYVPWVH